MTVYYQSALSRNSARFLSAKWMTEKMGLSLSSECQYWGGGAGLWRQTVPCPRGSHRKRTVTEGGPTSWRHQQRRWVDCWLFGIGANGPFSGPKWSLLVRLLCCFEVMVMFNVADCLSAVYSLFAVSNHTGSMLSGHYTAYTRHPYSSKWHCFNDARYLQLLPNVVE